jgi:hypothetical protein
VNENNKNMRLWLGNDLNRDFKGKKRDHEA